MTKRGVGGWVPFGRFLTVTSEEPSALPVELPRSEKMRFVTIEFEPGQAPRMTVSGEPVELETAIGRDGALVWRPKPLPRP